MANLFQDKRGNYHSRKRIPDAIREEYKKLYGQGLEAKFYAPASIGRLEALRRFNEWQTEIAGRFETIRRTLRGEGIDLDYKNATALAGEWYSWFVARHQNNPGDPVGYDVVADDLLDAMRDHYGFDPSYVIGKQDGWTVVKWPDAEIIRDPDVRQKMRPVIADLGYTAQFLAGRGIVLTNKARDLFLDCVLLNAVPALLRLEKYASGDYSPDELPQTFPAFDQNKAAQPTGLTPIELFEVWVKFRQPKHSTVESWRTVFRALAKQFPNAAEITPHQAQDWVDGLITKERSAFTVRNTWLRATKTVYKLAVKRRMVPSNPFKDVVVEKQRRPQYRPKHLREHEIAIILKAASSVDGQTSKPDIAARRWVPWLLAYTGARPSEITQLRGQDVKPIDGIWCLELTPDAGTIKTGEARVVPLHQHLVEQGFLEFAQRYNGPLFYRPRRGQQDTVDVWNQKKSPAAQARQRLAAWVREIGVKDQHLVRPLHAWRHTFKQRGDRHGLPEKALDYICGHAPATEGRGYGKPELKDLARAIEQFPRYDVGN